MRYFIVGIDVVALLSSASSARQKDVVVWKGVALVSALHDQTQGGQSSHE